jgi:hypothetical protein
MCLFAGIAASICLRPVFVATGIDQWMAPRPLVLLDDQCYRDTQCQAGGRLRCGAV